MLLGASVRVARCYLVNWIERDPVAYITMSKYIAQGEIKKAMKIRPEIPPLHITLMAVLTKTGLSAESAGVLISLVSGTLIILAVFLIATMLFNDKVALLAAFIASLQTELVHNSTFILRESQALCLMLFAVYFAMWAIQKHSWWKWCLSGFLTGLCGLTRPDGMEVFLAIPLWLVISFILYPIERRKILTKCLPGFVIFIVFFCAIIFPVQEYFQHHGSIYTALLDRKMLSLFLGLNI
jgi:4-amino-4-deoxy-L-arabinose transferase-like glycosyltransferase